MMKLSTVNHDVMMTDVMMMSIFRHQFFTWELGNFYYFTNNDSDVIDVSAVCGLWGTPEKVNPAAPFLRYFLSYFFSTVLVATPYVFPGKNALPLFSRCQSCRRFVVVVVVVVGGREGGSGDKDTPASSTVRV